MGVTGPWESHGTALAEAVKSGVGTARFGVSHLLPLPQSVLRRLDEIAKHEDALQDTDSQSEVRGGREGPPKARPAWRGIYGAPPPGCAALPPFFAPFHLPDPPDL